MTAITAISAAVLTMSSEEIASLVESRHDNVKTSIERLGARGVIQLPALQEVRNHLGQAVSVYQLCKRDSYVVVAQLSPEFTARLVDRWQELEAQAAPAVPRTMKEALRLALEQAEQIEQQQAALALAAPKVEFVDRFAAAETGAMGFRQVCKLLEGRGNILVLMGELSNESARTRTRDIEEVAATPECADMKILDKREGKWSRTQGQDITMNWLSSGMKFDAILANNDEMAIGAINALKAARKWRPNTIVAGIDATPDGLSSMKNGDLKVSVFQNLAGQGAKAVDAALRLAGKQPVERFVNVPFELVTPENMGQYARP